MAGQLFDSTGSRARLFHWNCLKHSTYLVLLSALLSLEALDCSCKSSVGKLLSAERSQYGCLDSLVDLVASSRLLD